MLNAAIGSGAWVRRRVMPAVLWLALAAGTAYAAWFLGGTTIYPNALEYGQGPLLDQVVRLTRGESIYRIPGTEPPWTVSNYPPMYPGGEAALAAVLGPAYWYGAVDRAYAAGPRIGTESGGSAVYTPRR
jgi:hypothetical protein